MPKFWNLNSRDPPTLCSIRPLHLGCEQLRRMMNLRRLTKRICIPYKIPERQLSIQVPLYTNISKVDFDIFWQQFHENSISREWAYRWVNPLGWTKNQSQITSSKRTERRIVLSNIFTPLGYQRTNYLNDYGIRFYTVLQAEQTIGCYFCNLIKNNFIQRTKFMHHNHRDRYVNSDNVMRSGVSSSVHFMSGKENFSWMNMSFPLPEYWPTIQQLNKFCSKNLQA